MGLIKTALKTAVAVKTANVVHDRIQRRKQAEWVAAGHTPESFPVQHLGDATATVVGSAGAWLSPNPVTSGSPLPPPSPMPSVGPVPLPPAPMDPVLAQLNELAGLRDRGVLTEDEFLAQKSRILGT